jgi:hypothetical protein
MHVCMQANGLTPRFTLPRKVADPKEPLPEQGRKVLQMLVMTAEETRELLRHGMPLDARKLPEREFLSVQLAVYTSFCKLLSLHLHAMEGPDGTGPLDDDLAIITKGEQGMSPEAWSCVVYRAGQKRIVREYLKLANEKLRSITEQMKALIAQPGTGK